MDLENQKRVKEFAEEYGAENLVVVLGAAEGEAAGLAAETVTLGDPTFAGPLTGVQLGLTVYHVCEPVRPNFRSPHNPIVILSSRPFKERIITRHKAHKTKVEQG